MNWTRPELVDKMGVEDSTQSIKFRQGKIEKQQCEA
mgnify:CR=1 FL=1